MRCACAGARCTARVHWLNRGDGAWLVLEYRGPGDRGRCACLAETTLPLRGKGVAASQRCMAGRLGAASV